MKHSCIALTILAVFFFLAAVEPAYAGQLHVTYFDMAAIARQGGLALVSTVLSVNLQEKRKKVRVRVEEVWIAHDEEEAYMMPLGSGDSDDGPYQPGKEYELPIYEGVVWTDPNESPIDFRVGGAIRVEDIQPQDRVVAVNVHGWELLPRDSDMERKLEVFFTSDGTRRYVEDTDTAQLKRDLADTDFYLLAREALTGRNELTAEAILEAASRKVRPFNMLLHHYEELSGEEQAAFVEAAAEHYSRAPHPVAMRDLIEVIGRTSPDAQEYREAKSRLLLLLVKGSHSEKDKELADWMVQRFPEWLSRGDRVLLYHRSDKEFLDWLLDEDPKEREAALEVAGRMEEKRRADLLERLLWGDMIREDDQSYGEAVALLAVLVPNAGPILAPHLRNDRAWRPAGAGLAAVGRPAVPSLCSLIDEFENTEIRSRAVLVLQLIGPEAGEAVPHLVPLLEEPALLRNVVAALGAMGPAANEAVPALESISTRASRGHRREIVQALENIGASRALEAARRRP